MHTGIGLVTVLLFPQGALAARYTALNHMIEEYKVVV